jgi:hypothetical protein
MLLGLSPKYVTDLGAILSCYALMTVAYYGLGEITARLLNFRGAGRPFPHVTWLGWAFSLLILQAIHLIFPIDYRVSTFVFATGVAVSAFVFPVQLRRYLKERTSRWYLYTLAVLAAAIWVGSRSMIPNDNDAGLYYLNMIHWINSYPIVPGLGNLHGRLAFNHSNFVYGASLNFFPYFRDGFRIGNGFLFLLLVSEMLWQVFAVIGKPRTVLQAHPLLHLPSFFIFPAVILCAVTTDVMGAVGSDFTSVVVLFQVFMMMTQKLNGSEDSYLQHDSLQIMALLAATAITIKLSNLAFAVSVFAIAFYYFVSATPVKRLSASAKFLVMPSLLICIWMVRGYILSGVPFYPSALFRLGFDWAVPRETIQSETLWVLGWARSPGESADAAVGNWNWVYPWILRLAGSIVDVVYPMLFGIFIVVVSIATRIVGGRKRMTRIGAEPFLLIAPAALGLVYWFLTAPDPRFATAAIWTLAAGGSLLFLSHAHGWLRRSFYAWTVGLTFLGLNLPAIRAIVRHPEFLRDISTVGFIAHKSDVLAERRTNSGLRVLVPGGTDDKCWDSPLPCTPYFNPRLELRKNDIGSGFRVR